MAWLTEPVKTWASTAPVSFRIPSDEKCRKTVPGVTKSAFRTPHTDGWMGGDVIGKGTGSYPVGGP